MVIELNQVAPWFAVIIAAIALVIAVRNRREDKESERVNAVELQVGVLGGKIGLVDDRVIRIESGLEHMPDSATTHKLELGLSELKREMTALNERMKPISAVADRLQDAILDRVMGHQ